MAKTFKNCTHCGALRFVNSYGYCKRCNDPWKRAKIDY